MNVKQLNHEQLASLNPGIRSTVWQFREWGFDTKDSGDGKTHQFDCDLKCPYVHIETTPDKLASEADRLLGLLKQSGVNFDNCPHPQDNPEEFADFPTVEASYSPIDGKAIIFTMNVILK